MNNFSLVRYYLKHIEAREIQSLFVLNLSCLRRCSNCMMLAQITSGTTNLRRKQMRALFVACAASFFVGLSTPTIAANSWGTDLSDVWSTPGEDGWGVSLTHQGEVVFMGLYVYGTDGRARWYTAALTSSGGNNRYLFQGNLIETTGPYFGGVFNQNTVIGRYVGFASLDISSVSRGTLRYTVDGVSVQKAIERYTLQTPNIGGTYVGAFVVKQSNCFPLGVYPGRFQTTQQGSSTTISATLDNGGRCTYSANYTQSGRMGAMAGTFSCTNGARGNFQAYEIEAGYVGLMGRYESQYSSPAGCTESGQLGGMKQ